MTINTQWLEHAIEAIRNGLADKFTKDGVTVYLVGNIIRIDIKFS